MVCGCKSAVGTGELQFIEGTMNANMYCNIHQLHDVIMEEWKRTPVATCEALVNSMPKRVKAVQENICGHTKY